MKITIGIDVGGSTTKIVGYSDGTVFSPLLVRANDPVASVYGAFGKFLSENKLSISDIEKIMVTGVGSTYLTENIYGIPTHKVDEFLAVGLGGQYLSKLHNAIIVSMGTGTAFVSAKGSEITHIGGTGIGGGTLLGLSGKILNIRNFDNIVELAEGGDLKHVDLAIGDISAAMLPNLPPHTTASNFGKISDVATKSDIAMGIINLVFETIGVMAAFASKIYDTNDIVLIGKLASVPQAKGIYDTIANLYSLRFIIPEHAEFATALGAALSCSSSAIK